MRRRPFEHTRRMYAEPWPWLRPKLRLPPVVKWMQTEL
jgi:hypothetical protein